MSGPKTYGYAVDQARLEREREEARRRAELAELRRRFENLRARVAEWQAVYGSSAITDVAMPTSDSPAEIRTALGEAELTLRTSIANARDAKLAEAFDHTELDLESGAPAPERASSDSPAPARSNAEVVAELKQHGGNVAARLNPGADQADAELVDLALKRLGESRSADDAELHMDSLRERVAKANSRALMREETNTLLDEVRVELAGLDGPEVSAALALADELEQESRLADDDAREQFAEAAAAGRALAERRHVAAVMRDALRDQKYEVGEDFETVLVSGGEIDVRKNVTDANWTGYAVRVVSNPEKGEVTSYVVRGERIDGGNDDFDQMIETNWCADYGRVIEAASREGVELGRVRSKEPGELRLLEVPELVSPERAGRRAQAQNKREMEL